MNSKWKTTLAFVAGIFGGLLAMSFSAHVPVVHAYTADLSGSALRLTDSQGKPYALLEKGDHQASALAFYNQAGHARLKLGLDPEGVPYIALLSEQETPKALFKLTGNQESALLIFKDHANHARILMGLNGNTEDPYLVYLDKNLNRHVVFGKVS